MSPAAVTEDAPVAQEQWINPDARPQGRRLTPIVQDGIVRAWRAGVPNSRIARVCGVSHTTVRRVIERMTPDLEQALSDLSEIADAERELRAAGAELGVDPTTPGERHRGHPLRPRLPQEPGARRCKRLRRSRTP